jgi:hypothetical protein
VAQSHLAPNVAITDVAHGRFPTSFRKILNHSFGSADKT